MRSCAGPELCDPLRSTSVRSLTHPPTRPAFFLQEERASPLALPVRFEHRTGESQVNCCQQALPRPQCCEGCCELLVCPTEHSFSRRVLPPGTQVLPRHRSRAGARACRRACVVRQRSAGHGDRAAMSAGNYMFMVVAEGDTPIYEAEFINKERVRCGERAPAFLRRSLPPPSLWPVPRRPTASRPTPHHSPCCRISARGQLAPQPVHHPRRPRHGR